MNDKKYSIIIWGVIILGIAGIVFGMLAVIKRPSQGGVLDPVSSADWVIGTKNPKTTLIEYSDFQCPACGYYYPMVKRLVSDFPNDLQAVYRNFPLTQIHKNAMSSARADGAAGLQGKFWEMQDMIFAHQKDWSESDGASAIFISYAQALGLDTIKFQKDFNSSAVIDKINADIQSGNRANINATPTFFVNGKQITNPNSYDEFKEIISESLK